MAISAETAVAKQITELAAALETAVAVAREVEARYFKAGISAIVNSTSNGQGVGDSGIIKADYVEYLTLVQQLLNFADNKAVAQSDYLQTMAKGGLYQDRANG